MKRFLTLVLFLISRQASASLDVATGTFSIGTGAVGTTTSVTSLAFQPKVVIFSWVGLTASGQSEGDHKFGMGYMISASDRGGAASQSDHGVGTSASDNQVFNDAAIKLLTTSGAVDGAADYDAFLSNGFRVIIDDAFSSSWIINYLAIGGSDLTDVVSTTITPPTITGTDQDINVGLNLDTGLDDKCVLFFGGGAVTINVTDIYSTLGFGAAAGSTPVNAIMAGNSDDGAGTSATIAYCRSGECIATVYDDAVDVRALVTAWLSTGFRLNFPDVSSTPFPWRALVLKGGRYEVGNALTSTGTSNQTEATTYVPKALIVASSNRAESTVGVVTARDERSVGFATSATERNYVSIIDKDAAGTMDIGRAQNTNAMYANQSTAGTIIIEGLMDLVSFDATPSFTYVMDDADPSAAYFWYLSMADTLAAGGATYKWWGKEW